MPKKAKTRASRRDPVTTRERVLRAGIAEFCRKGYDGARMEQIARRSGANVRMIYHYFGSKERLYVATLERVYSEVRSKEIALNLRDHTPIDGMLSLVNFTFNHLLNHPEFIELIRNENLLRGRYLRKSNFVPLATIPLVDTVKDLLERGVKEGVFHRNVDPVQLYISLLSLCYIHLSNRYTLSIMFDRNLADDRWLRRRRKHVGEIILTYLTAPDSGAERRAAATRKRAKGAARVKRGASAG